MIFTTGGSGAIGQPFLSYCAEKGLPVRVLVHRQTPAVTGLETVSGELADFRKEWLDGVDAVVHLAALVSSDGDPATVFKTNVEGTQRVVDALSSLDRSVRLIFPSTVVVCGPNRDGQPLTSESPRRPVTAYGKSKAEAEQIVATYPHSVIVRLPMVVGPNDRSSPRFVRYVRRGVFPVPPTRLSAIDERDVARLIAHLIDDPNVEGRTYTVTDGETYAWADVAGHFARRVGRRVWRPTFPKFLLHPALMRLTGRSDMAYYLRYDWHCDSNYPAGYEPRFKVYR